jgi:intracellular sulfur oxidation DsrE/DsrF family protein
MPTKTITSLLSASLLLMTGPIHAAPAGLLYPVIPQFGGIVAVPDAAERPDPKLRYRVVFDITKPSASPDKINPSLEKVARFVNLLGEDKVRPAAGDIVAIVHGPATPVVLQSAPYAARTKIAENPNVALIRALQKAGVSVQVCGQAMIGSGILADQVTPGIVIDDSALTTLANLQLRGYALIPD